jgi:hypothetical protein
MAATTLELRSCGQFRLWKRPPSRWRYYHWSIATACARSNRAQLLSPEYCSLISSFIGCEANVSVVFALSRFGTVKKCRRPPSCARPKLCRGWDQRRLSCIVSSHHPIHRHPRRWKTQHHARTPYYVCHWPRPGTPSKRRVLGRRCSH